MCAGTGECIVYIHFTCLQRVKFTVSHLPVYMYNIHVHVVWHSLFVHYVHVPKRQVSSMGHILILLHTNGLELSDLPVQRERILVDFIINTCTSHCVQLHVDVQHLPVRSIIHLHVVTCITLSTSCQILVL